MSDPTGGAGDAPVGDWLTKTDPSTLPSADDILEGQIEQAVRHERARQIALGYDDAHDDRHGTTELLEFAYQYARAGKFIKALAMHAAAADVERRQSERVTARRAAEQARDVARRAIADAPCSYHPDGSHFYEPEYSGRGIGWDHVCACGAVRNARPFV